MKKLIKVVLVGVTLLTLTGCQEDGSVTQKSFLEWLGFTVETREVQRGIRIEVVPNYDE